MTRRLLAFFAPSMLAAQMYPPSKWRPKNGQCPACGTMAAKYNPDYPAMARRIDCAWCCCTFRQWAGKEPKR